MEGIGCQPLGTLSQVKANAEIESDFIFQLSFLNYTLAFVNELINERISILRHEWLTLSWTKSILLPVGFISMSFPLLYVPLTDVACINTMHKLAEIINFAGVHRCFKYWSLSTACARLFPSSLTFPNA